MSQLEPAWKFGESESHVPLLDETMSAYDLSISPLTTTITQRHLDSHSEPTACSGGLELATSLLLLLNAEDEHLYKPEDNCQNKASAMCMFKVLGFPFKSSRGPVGNFQPS